MPCDSGNVGSHVTQETRARSVDDVAGYVGGPDDTADLDGGGTIDFEEFTEVMQDKTGAAKVGRCRLNR